MKRSAFSEKYPRKTFVGKFFPFSRRRTFKVLASGQGSSGMPYAAQTEKPFTFSKRIGDLEVRLAQNSTEIKHLQRLRYNVFYKEMSAHSNAMMRATRRDADPFDAICDHLLIIDHGASTRRFRHKKSKIVGTYRLLRQDIAEHHGGFYTADEFAIEPLLKNHPNKRFLELGRSCVLKTHRNKGTLDMLWIGIWSYVKHYGIDAMLGCASFEGTDPAEHALGLSYLHHFHGAPRDWTASAYKSHFINMDCITKDKIDPKQALRQIPPLIKGYLRVGAYIGEGAVIDEQFGTTDVLAVMPIANISEKYVKYYDSRL